MADNLFSSDYITTKIYKHLGFSVTITDSFSSPSTGPAGLAWDGTNIYSVDYNLEKVYKHSGFSVVILDSFSSPSIFPLGLTWDGSNINSADYSQDRIYKHDGFSASILDSFSSPSTGPIGLTWDGTNLYSIGDSPDKIYKHDGFSVTILDSFSSPATWPTGLAWDGANIYSGDELGKIYKHLGFSATVSDSFAANPQGLSWESASGPESPEADSGILGLPEASIDSAICGMSEDIDLGTLSGISGVRTKEADADSGIKSLGFTDVDSGILGKEFLGVGSAIIGGDLSIDRIWAIFNNKTMDNVSAVSSQEDLVTVLRILFDYDYGRQAFRKAVQLEVKESIAKYGRIEKEIQAYWLTSFRIAVQMGERQLKYYARPKWSVSFVSSLDYADIPSGEWVSIEEHPLLPVSGRILVTDAPLDLSAGEVSFTAEKVVGPPVDVEITRLSEAYEFVPDEAITITYRDGVATITILDELGEPLAGASVMLDGADVRTTDNLGRVQFTTTRGKHRLLVEATGYAPLEFEIEV